MKICVLGSGSKGNCTLVQSGGTTLLIDAGFSGIEIKRRLALIGLGLESVTAILVTHEHNDHICGVGVLSRRGRLPVHANPATHRAAEKKTGMLFSRCDFDTGEKFSIGNLQIHPFAVSHDTADPVGYVLSDGTSNVGYCTDTGKVTALMEHHLKCCDILILESNHDPKMLREGPYPLYLQQRVRSNRGHLANEDAGRLLQKIAGGRLRYAVLAHLSEINNMPSLAVQAAVNHLGELAPCIEIIPASQQNPSQVIHISGR
ncbi:MAG: MBL fold metallo-hydrolase [Desulfobulbaceae bacterium]|nr:MBL fold metallo-hydrolase [Desulfobulbaceae bacterium]